jgi:hypothetical protein
MRISFSPSSSRHWEKTHRGGHFVTFFPDLIYSSIFSLFFKFGGEMLEEKISRPKKAQKRTEPKPCGDRKRRGSGNKGGKKKKKEIFRTESPSTTTVNQTGPNVPPLYFVPMHTRRPSTFFVDVLFWPIIARFANGFFFSNDLLTVQR